jgi:hypothetical protein
MPSVLRTSAEDVIDQPARKQFEVFLDEHRDALNRCLDGLNEEQVRRSLVPSRTTLLWLLKHAIFVERVWFDEAITCRSRAEIGIPHAGRVVRRPGRRHYRHRSASTPRSMRGITPRGLRLGVGRLRPRQPPRSAPIALGLPPYAARTRPALRARRHPPRATSQHVADAPASAADRSSRFVTAPGAWRWAGRYAGAYERRAERAARTR